MSAANEYSHPPTGYPNPLANRYEQSDENQKFLPPPRYGENDPRHAEPITNQPSSNQVWSGVPQGLPLCPRGLEYLTTVDQLVVHQVIKMISCVVRNKFNVMNIEGELVYTVIENIDCWMKNLQIFDNMEQEIIHLEHIMMCWGRKLEVSSPPGTVIGNIEMETVWFTPTFAVRDEHGQTVLKIIGPNGCSECPIFRDIEFKVMALDGYTQVGKICRKWRGFRREAWSPNDHFGISFPMDLDVKIKAILLGACIFIDRLYFDTRNN